MWRVSHIAKQIIIGQYMVDKNSFFFQYSSQSEVAGGAVGGQAQKKQWKRQMVLLVCPTNSVKLNRFISQVTFPRLQVSRERETQISSSVSYFRFYILVTSYDICLSLSGLFHLVWNSLGLSMLLQMVLIHSFSSTQLCTMSSLSIPLLMDI